MIKEYTTHTSDGKHYFHVEVDGFSYPAEKYDLYGDPIDDSVSYERAQEMAVERALICAHRKSRPRPMSEMKDEYRDGREIWLWVRFARFPTFWKYRRDGWCTCGGIIARPDTDFTHFMLIPTIEEN
jgi:hypothetical protein